MIARSGTRSALRYLQAGRNSAFDLEEEGIEAPATYQRPVVQWYPGHIAKAERQLAETLKAVDVVLEVRDARIPSATQHPSVPTWCAGRPRIVILTHSDLIPSFSRRAWDAYYQTSDPTADEQSKMDGQSRNKANQALVEQQKYLSESSKTKDYKNVFFLDARKADGPVIHTLSKAIYSAGSHVQARRESRGLQPRPLRVGVLGYPNVGKSALINKLVGGRKRARSANTPGVTRTLQWIRVSTSREYNKKTSKTFELLDSPGIIPATLVDQTDAMLLAACNCIGQAAYDNQGIAAFLCQRMIANLDQTDAPMFQDECKKRYGIDMSNGTDMSGEDFLYTVADKSCRGSPEDAARKILQDFRTGRWGLVCLQTPPGEAAPVMLEKQDNRQDYDKRHHDAALQRAQDADIQLPPSVALPSKGDNLSKTAGKGIFEGW